MLTHTHTYTHSLYVRMWKQTINTHSHRHDEGQEEVFVRGEKTWTRKVYFSRVSGEKTERGRKWSRSCYLIWKEGQVHRWSWLKVGWVGIWLEELSCDIRSTDGEEDATETCARRTKRSQEHLCLSLPPSPPAQLHVPSQRGGALREKKKKKRVECLQ